MTEMAQIAVVKTYKTSMKKKRPWKNINRILSKLQDEEESKPLTAFDALYLNNIKRGRKFKRKVEAKTAKCAETPILRAESSLDSTFDRILAGPVLQGPHRLEETGSSEFANSSVTSSSDSTCDSPFKNRVLWKKRSSKYTNFSPRQLRSHKAKSSRVTSTPKNLPIRDSHTSIIQECEECDKENVCSVTVSDSIVASKSLNKRDSTSTRVALRSISGNENVELSLVHSLRHLGLETPDSADSNERFKEFLRNKDINGDQSQVSEEEKPTDVSQCAHAEEDVWPHSDNEVFVTINSSSTSMEHSATESNNQEESAEASVLLFQSWELSFGTQGDPSRPATSDVHGGNSSVEVISDDDEIPLVYLKNNVSPLELKKTEGSGDPSRSATSDVQDGNSSVEVISDDDEIPLVYLKNNVSPLELKKTEGSGAGRGRRLSCRRLSHQVLPCLEEAGPHITSPSFRDVYRTSGKTIYESILEENEEDIVQEPRENSILYVDDVSFSFSFTGRDAVLQRCNQSEPIAFSEAYPSGYWENCRKIGEGVYGEVFMSEGEDSSVLKIMPIEGDQLVNGEPQKKFDEILSEIVITMELSDLRNGTVNRTQGFSEIKRCLCVQGRYPEELVDLWDVYNNEKGSENDCPTMFMDNQLYIILELANEGRDLEAYVFTTAEQSLSILVQTAYALAVAEEALEFEHRDLHWGNVLVSPTSEKHIVYLLSGKEYLVPTRGVEVGIIDFTLSRMTYDGCYIYNDLSRDPEFFTGQGDYQFEVYRLMQKHTSNAWDSFVPFTNMLWLHYLAEKMFTMVYYEKKKAKSHKLTLDFLKDLHSVALDYRSAAEFVLSKGEQICDFL